MKKATEKDLKGWEWRRVKRGSREVLQRYRKVRVMSGYETFTVDDLRGHIKQHKLQESDFELEQEYEYGEQYARILLRGWSDATKEEIRDEVAKIQERLDYQEKRDLEDLERLRKQRPDLFK